MCCPGERASEAEHARKRAQSAAKAGRLTGDLDAAVAALGTEPLDALANRNGERDSATSGRKATRLLGVGAARPPPPRRNRIRDLAAAAKRVSSAAARRVSLTPRFRRSSQRASFRDGSPGPPRTAPPRSTWAIPPPPPSPTALASAAPRRARAMSAQPFRPDDFAPRRLLGRGAFGVVALAERRPPPSPRTGLRSAPPPENFPRVQVAIKVVRKELLVGSRAAALARVERDVLDALAHRKCAFVAKLRFAFQSPSKLFLAMDYYPAGSLDAVLESRAFRRKDARAAARRVGAELAAALGRVHELCVLHRDLKPSNVLVDAAGHVALSDFGLATRVDRPGGVVKKRSFAGTVNYAAPELLLKSRETYGGAVDCWALGCLLFEMLEGAPPFKAPTARETFTRIAGPEPAPVPGDVDEDCATTLAHLLEKDPGRRLAAAKAPDSRWWCTLDFAALDREPGPLASIAAVITECAKMDDDELDPSIADLFAYDGGGDDADADAFAGFGRAESVAERPSDATNVFV